MYQVQQTDIFAKWLLKLKDRRAIAKILVRIESLRQGNSGDSKSLGSGVHELRIHFGQVIESITLESLAWWFSFFVGETSRAKART
jgi:putative component of toxin-antitoxin plasmid stabilization module